MNYLVSIIIPLYNGEKYIGECLDSIFKQNYTNFEIIIVDDGSTDSSLQIIAKYKSQKIKIFQQNNGDVSNARNNGIKYSAGELIAFIDQDDLWLPEKLKKQVKLFEENLNTDLIFCDIIKFSNSGKKHHAKDKHQIALSLNETNLFSKLIVKNVLMPSAVIVRKDSFIEAGMFDPTFKTCGDYEMWLRMAVQRRKFVYLPEALTLYRVHENNASKNAKLMFLDRIKAVEQAFKIMEINDVNKEFEKTGLASAYMQGANEFFSGKDYKQYLINANRAFELNKKIINTKYLSRYIRSIILTIIGKYVK